MLLLMVAAPASETSSVGSSHAQIAVFLLVSTVAASFVKKTGLSFVVDVNRCLL